MVLDAFFRRNTLVEKECLVFVSPIVVLPTCNSTDCIEIIFDHSVDRAGVGSQPQCECFKSCSFFQWGFQLLWKILNPQSFILPSLCSCNGHTECLLLDRSVVCHAINHGMNESVREDEQTLNCNHPSGWYHYPGLIYCKASADRSRFLWSDIDEFMKDARTLLLSYFCSIHILTLCYMKNMIVPFVRKNNLNNLRFVAIKT